MCGIVGVISRARVEPDVVIRMRDSLRHRGPDDRGLWQSEDGSVSLGHRRLAIIDRAAHSGDGPRLGYDDPLKRAWARGHTDMLREFEPAGHWYVPSEMYWNLYDRYKDAPWADELAWAAAQATQPGDECYTNCHLGMIVAGPLQYWTRLPRGAAIGQALREAIARAGYAMQKSSYETPERGLLDQIRNSLSSVTAPEKSRL